MTGFTRTRSRRILGGKSGAIVGSLGLNENGGTISPLPNWMRGGTEGGFAGFFTMTSSTIENLSRLFHLSNADDTERFHCFIEPASNRWQAQIRTNNIERTVIYITAPPPTIGQTIGFAVTWRANRIAMAIGGFTMQASSYDIPLMTCNTFILGNRPDGLRELPATYPLLEWFNRYIDDASLSALASRFIPAVGAAAPPQTFSIYREDAFDVFREESGSVLREE